MNAQSHRLIFNPTRGCMIAVAETSRSSGKSSASGTTRSTRTQRRRCPPAADVQASNAPLVHVVIAQAATNLIAKNGTGTGTLRVEGKNNTALYEVQDFKQVTTTTQTKNGKY